MPSWAQSSDRDRTVRDARELSDRIRSVTSPQAPAQRQSEAATNAPKGDPCTLLTASEVRKFFPKASTPKRDRSNEQYGLADCIWDYPGGRLGVQITTNSPGTALAEAKGLAAGFTDPLKPGSDRSVRYEVVRGVGDQAYAVVEPRDTAKGVLSDAAFIVGQRGERQFTIFSSDLARGDRDIALRSLQELGRSAAARL